MSTTMTSQTDERDTVDEYVAQFRILTKLTANKMLIKYFIKGINTRILQKIFGQNLLPAMINDWYNAATKFDSQHRRLQDSKLRQRRQTPQDSLEATRTTQMQWMWTDSPQMNVGSTLKRIDASTITG